MKKSPIDNRSAGGVFACHPSNCYCWLPGVGERVSYFPREKDWLQISCAHHKGVSSLLPPEESGSLAIWDSTSRNWSLWPPNRVISSIRKDHSIWPRSRKDSSGKPKVIEDLKIGPFYHHSWYHLMRRNGTHSKRNPHRKNKHSKSIDVIVRVFRKK